MPITGYCGGIITRPISTLLLDQLSGPAVIALSSRKLRSAYAGVAMNVVRSSDSTAQDVGFSGSDFDTNALASFVGSNSGSVATWYDQSGNGNQAGNATVVNQPLVVNAGVNYTINGKVSPFAIAANSMKLKFPNALTINQPFSIGFVFKHGNTNNQFWFDSDGSRRIVVGTFGGSYGMQGSTLGGNGGTADTNLHSLWAIFNGATSFMYLDGTAIISNLDVGSTSTWGDGVTSEHMFQGPSGQFIYDGYIAEVVVMNSVVSAGDMATARSNWQTYWGVP